MTTAKIHPIIDRALAVVADNAARRVLAGQPVGYAKKAALAEFAEKWPNLARHLEAIVLRSEDVN